MRQQVNDRLLSQKKRAIRAQHFVAYRPNEREDFRKSTRQWPGVGTRWAKVQEVAVERNSRTTQKNKKKEYSVTSTANAASCLGETHNRQAEQSWVPADPHFLSLFIFMFQKLFVVGCAGLRAVPCPLHLMTKKLRFFVLFQGPPTTPKSAAHPRLLLFFSPPAAGG